MHNGGLYKFQYKEGISPFSINPETKLTSLSMHYFSWEVRCSVVELAMHLRAMVRKILTRMAVTYS